MRAPFRNRRIGGLTMDDRLEYYDPARQDIDSEHERCVVEDGERWFGHGMLCRRPELHKIQVPKPADRGSGDGAS